MTPSANAQGFTLIEALVALAILAIAAVGLVRAAEAHVDSVRGLEMRTAAQLVAENELVELGLRGAPHLDDEVTMMGYHWTIVRQFTPTTDPDLRAVKISVRPQGQADATFVLEGFTDTGTTTP